VRESQAIPIYHELIERGAKVVAHDPKAAETMKRILVDLQFAQTAKELVDQSDAVLILTGWPEHASPDLYKDTVVIDGRRIIPKSACKKYEGICW